MIHDFKVTKVEGSEGVSEQGGMQQQSIALCGSAMAAGFSREREWPTNAQLFLIGNSAPMADLHSGACTSLNPWPCQTQPWGEGRGNKREKNKREEKLESGWVKETRGEKRKKEVVLLFFFCWMLQVQHNVHACLMTECVRELVPANVSKVPKCSCAHLTGRKKRRE